jgi:hypothetical protein
MSKALATKNVAAALIGLGLVAAFAFSFATPAKADTLSGLQAQVQALLAQIATLQGSSSSSTTGGACFTFTQTLTVGSKGSEVMNLQKFLNSHGAVVASTGAGSPGNETSTFGPATKAAVAKWQKANGISPAAGYWGALTRAAANKACTSTTGGTTTGGTTTPTGPGISVTAGAQPANSLAPQNASRVPFTTFTLTNNTGAAVTITGVSVQRTGLAQDAVFAGVVLVDSNGLQYGNSQTFNSNHQATVGGTFTLQAGQSMTYTVAGNMAANEAAYAGQVAGISVVGVNTSVPVTGSLPITGAQQTINATLTIGTATLGISGFDPNGHRSQAIGTTGLTFSGVRITAGSAEDQKLYSITWNQTGSAGATDLSNLKTVVNGTSYPVTVDSSGKYFSSVFPGGILVTKGNSADVYIQGDITGSNASGRTVEFDVYRASDIYLVGQLYGYGISPTASDSGTNTTGANSSSGFKAAGSPLYFGTYVSVTGGTLSTVSSASSVPPQNIGVNVPNQTLGGFTTNFTGEPVTVQSVVVNVASTTGALGLTNVSLVASNGTTVAGPVDEAYVGANSGTITFNTTVTFPVGVMTYTIKGTVKTGSTNGSTFTLSTNPNTNWTSPVGQTSGSTLTLTNTTITMSTMTVQPGALTIAASASPAATTITTNQNNFTLANIVLDASQSGSDVQLNSLPIVVNATGTVTTNSANSFSLNTNLTNCQLYQGSNALNSAAIGSSDWTAKTNVTGIGGSNDGIEANFIFTSPLKVAKGTSVTLALMCNVGGSLYSGETFSAGVHSNYAPTVTDSTGNTVSPTVTSSASGVMTIGTPSLSVTVPSMTYQAVAGGTTGVNIGSFTLQSTSGNVSLSNIELKLNSAKATPSDLVNGLVKIMQGTTVVGTANFNGVTASGGFYLAPTTTVTNVTLQQNVLTTFTLQADIAAIGSGQSGSSGDEILVGLANAQGTSGNTSVNSGTATQPAAGNGTGIFATYPTVAAGTLPSNGNADGKLIAFSVTANSKQQLGLDQFVFTFASSTGVTITNPALYYGNAAGSETTLVANSGVSATTYTSNALGNIASTTLQSPLEIPAGSTWYFLLKAQSLTYSGSANTYSITTTLKGDSTDLSSAGAGMLTGAAATTTYNFVWSPNSTTQSTGQSTDWSNGYGITGLPQFGISTTRSN